MKRYFVYGSNMDEIQMKERCPQSEKQEKAELSEYEFFINARGVASIHKVESGKVWGVVYKITEADEKKLDSYEGYPKSYQKQFLPELNAFCYVDTRTNEGSPRKGYLEKIIKAAEVNDFPKEYVAELKSWFNR